MTFLRNVCRLYVGKVKSLSEALIFGSTNSQYEDIMFIELQVQYVKIPKLRTWGEHIVYRN